MNQVAGLLILIFGVHHSALALITSPAPMPTAVAPAPAITPPAPATALPAVSNPDLDQINNQLQDINVAREALKALLAKIDGYIVKGKDLVIEARNKSMVILKQQSDDAARAIQNEVNQSLQQLTQMEQDLQSSLIPNFQATIEKVKNDMSKASENIKTMQAKGAALQSQPAQQVAPSQATQTYHAPQNVVKATESTTEPSKEMLIYYIFRRLADLVIAFIHMLTNCLQGIRNFIMPSSTLPGLSGS